MLRSLSLFLLLAACTSASFIIPYEVDRQSQTARAFINGGFRLVARLSGTCPQRIIHSGLGGDDNRVPHQLITMNNQSCTDGFMNTYLDPVEAKDALDSDDAKDVVDIYSAELETVVYGVELEGRTCGDVALQPGTLLLFFIPTEDVFVAGTSFEAGRRNMAIFDTAAEATCFLRSRVLNPPSSESPTPEPPTPEPPTPASPTPEPSAPTAQPGTTPPSTGGSQQPNVSAVPSPSTEEPGSDDDMEESPTGEATDPDGETPQPSEEDDSVCFPGDAEVELESGVVKNMKDLELGDRVKVGEGMFSDVFMFTHKDSTIAYKFVKIVTNAGADLSVTSGHYIYVNGGLASAGTVKVGDRLELADGTSTTVLEVRSETKVGLYNPQTVHGDIIVNSIRASTYTRVVEPSAAQALMAPLRLLYGAFGMSASFLDNGADNIAQMLPQGQASL